MEEYKTDPRGQLVIDFVSRLKLIGDYYGERWKIEPWQEEILRKLYGSRKEDGDRLINKLFLFLPRKVGKTQIAAAIAMVQLFLGPPGQEIYAASADRDKASRIFKAVAGMIRQDKTLAAKADISDYFLRVKIKGKDSVLQCLASDQDQGHSLSPSCLILDELHLWRGTNLYTALTTGSAARKKGRLDVLITTAGKSKQGLCWDLYTDAKNILNGVVVQPDYLPVIYEAAPDDDWNDERTWYKAIPSLGTFTELDVIRDLYKEAQRIKWREWDFRQLYLNQWLDVATGDPWIDPIAWNKCRQDYTADDLIGATCTGALDLSRTTDLTALSLFFPEQGHTLSFGFLPAEKLREREDRDLVPYLTWRQQGWLYTTTGNRIVYSEVADKVNEILEKYNVVKLVADPYALNLIQPFLSREAETYKQNPVWMSTPSKWFEGAVHAGKIKWNSPLLSWCVLNTVVTEDKFENISPAKDKSSKRIDNAVALIMAIGSWIGSKEEPVSDFWACQV